jgi:O-antigen/teichoic acid export membrane protein
MSSLKNLASQTIWYGLSNIAARFIGYLQTPIITYLLPDSKGQQAYGDFSILYAGISMANIVFTYGMETAYFRFSAEKENKEDLFRTSFSTILLSTLVLSTLFILFRQPIANILAQEAHPEYITWAVIIIAFDTLSAIPFAKLRQEGRPKKYAAVKVSGILLNLILTVTLLYAGQQYVDVNPNTELALWYKSHSKGGLLLLPNIAQSLLTFILLFSEWKNFKFGIDTELLHKLWRFGSPMIIIGLGGMINETMDRVMLNEFYNGTEAAAKAAVGVYGANYRIAIFISLFIQAFKMSAEPFFFKQAKEKNAADTYAIVMKWFVITLCIAFLFTALFLDFWKHLNPSSYWDGLKIVPLLLLANVFLGIYYNLIAALKISNNMDKITYITIIGAIITILINITFIPQYGMMACAWATLICYFLMMILAYGWGQMYYPIKYPRRRIATYLIVMLLSYAIHSLVIQDTDSVWAEWLSAVILFFSFIFLIFYLEKEQLKRLPFLGKFIA